MFFCNFLYLIEFGEFFVLELSVVYCVKVVCLIFFGVLFLFVLGVRFLSICFWKF